jgi:site-specific recombinase XerD
MSVFKPKNSRFYWYEFVYKGQRYRASTRQRNYKTALDIESARRTELAKGNAGIGQKRPAPTLQEFAKDFVAWVEEAKKEKPKTVEFYEDCYTALLGFKPLATARMDTIDEPLVERFKSRKIAEGFSKTTVNRYLATLRKALRYASLKQKLFDGLPVITLYAKSDGAERRRDFIYSAKDYENWLAIAPEPLRSASVMARETAICRNEMLALRKDCVTLNQGADENGLYGRIDIRRGLKRDARRRSLPVNAAVRDVLIPLLERSQCEYVFTALEDSQKPLSPWTLEGQLSRTRKALKLHPDAGLHAMRHTRLTELGRVVDPFTLQRIAGHERIETTMLYVHVQQEAITAAFAMKERSVPLKFPLQSNRSKVEDVYN